LGMSALPDGLSGRLKSVTVASRLGPNQALDVLEKIQKSSY
jgi:hypothetical protein